MTAAATADMADEITRLCAVIDHLRDELAALGDRYDRTANTLAAALAEIVGLRSNLRDQHVLNAEAGQRIAELSTVAQVYGWDGDLAAAVRIAHAADQWALLAPRLAGAERVITAARRVVTTANRPELGHTDRADLLTVDIDDLAAALEDL